MDTCRICLETDGVASMQNSIISGRTILEIFTDCIGIKVDTNEPASVCQSCETKLIDFYQFKELAITNSKHFLNDIKLETEELVEERIETEACIEMPFEPDTYDEGVTVAYPIVKTEIAAEDNGNQTEASSEEEQFIEEKPTKKKYPKRLKDPEKYTDDVIRCPNCLKSFETVKQVARHLKVHEIEAGGLTCHVCSKVFDDPRKRNRQAILRHLRRVHFKDPNERFECNICGVTFSQREAVTTHKRFVHAKSAGNGVCHVCGKIFRDNSRLVAHVKFKHENIVENFCPQCGKGFANQFCLKNHIIARHSAERMFACQFCDRRFTSQSNKITHEKIHLMASDNAELQKKLERSASRKRYRERGIEPPPKLYQCSICQQTLSTQAGLKYHESRHTETQFPCSACDNVYVSQTSLNTHMRSVHLGIVYDCLYCSKTFTRKTSVVRHIESNHKHRPAVEEIQPCND